MQAKSMTFFSFSGYTKGLFAIMDISKASADYLLTIKIDGGMFNRINKKMKSLTAKHAFKGPFCVEVDGVPAQIKEIDQSNQDYYLKLRVISDLFERSTLAKLSKGNEVSLGLQSFNKKKYLVGQYSQETTSVHPLGQAQLLSCKIADGHAHTQELTFEASLNLLSLFDEKKCIGLNGGAFFIRNYEKLEDKIRFQIHIGRLTREKTNFGSEKMAIGQYINITRAFMEEESLYEAQSIGFPSK
jgi:riboflavin synthase alpha subunit